MNISKSLLLSLLLQSCIAPTLLSSQETPEPYNSTPTLPLMMHGWFGPTNQRYLLYFLQQYQPKIVVELGSWMGLSTIFMAKNMAKGTTLYAVDTWLGSVEHQDPQFSHFLPTLYQQFLSNCKHHQVTDIVVPVRMTTLEAAATLDIKPNLVYVDASHAEEDVYRDIMAWTPKLLAPNGIMCGDDWGWESVRKGVIRAAQELGKKIKVDDNFWYFEF